MSKGFIASHWTAEVVTKMFLFYLQVTSRVGVCTVSTWVKRWACTLTHTTCSVASPWKWCVRVVSLLTPVCTSWGGHDNRPSIIWCYTLQVMRMKSLRKSIGMYVCMFVRVLWLYIVATFITLKVKNQIVLTKNLTESCCDVLWSGIYYDVVPNTFSQILSALWS